MEGGAEFIGQPECYPNVHTLLDHLGVHLNKFELNMDFHDLRDDEHLVMPPIYHASDGKESYLGNCLSALLSVVGLFRNNIPQKKLKVALNPLIAELCDLLNLNAIINRAKNKLLHSDDVLTLEQFVDDFISKDAGFPYHRDQFANDVLYPLIASGWGVSIDTIKTFGAHCAMYYLEAGKDWYDAPDGLSTYIHNMAEQCTNTQFKINTAIKQVVPVIEMGKTKYKLLQQDNSFHSDPEGKPILFDEVVISTPAYSSMELLSGVDDLMIKALREKLAKVTYYDTKIVFHRDPDYLSPYHTVVHTRFDGKIAANTMCKQWEFSSEETPIMKTWVLPGQAMPKNVLREVMYRHPVMDINYYEAQQALHQFQGYTGLWYGGVIAGQTDAHESGITVALQIAINKCYQADCLERNERLAMFSPLIEETLGKIGKAGNELDITEPSDAYLGLIVF
ncbi:amine oxidase, flavin containing [Legionella waltersii]|uniref:Amine oxidase, flavin containing n=1 Tax=Legionella waltersii TaxID=66969 RepID=A0A0W1ABS2_9GAMM|nr:amine oxidase [Legionella waltersii]KTD78799.1 amine oxidase, flavin containing [Legionella waltersii]SNV11082.1 amine oxidase, flavin containing [Legionella waltersii]